ncbi:MAG: ABC transporter permease subunit [Chloroflexia bacterium]
MGPSLPRARAFLLALAPALVLLALWEWFVRAFGVDPVFLPAPSRVAQAGFDSAGLLVVAARRDDAGGRARARTRVRRGVLLGLAIDLSPVVRRTLYPLLVVSQTIPMIALAPLLVLWFGFGITPKLLVVALVCFFPIAVAVADGLGNAEPR